MTAPVFHVVPCGAEKAPGARPARDLYTSSQFKLALAAAEACAREDGGTVLVLSALHGLVGLDDVLEPYDLKLGDEYSVAPEVVRLQALCRGVGIGERTDVYAFLPRAYYALLDAALRPLCVYAQDVYEACGGIGEQRKACRVTRDAPFPRGEL